MLFSGQSRSSEERKGRRRSRPLPRQSPPAAIRTAEREPITRLRHPQEHTRQISALLQRNETTLLERWCATVLQARPDLTSFPALEPVLLHLVPGILDDLVDAFAALSESERGLESLDWLRESWRARLRARQAADERSLRAALQELTLLRSAMLELCDEAGLPLTGRAGVLMHRLIDAFMLLLQEAAAQEHVRWRGPHLSFSHP